VNRPGLVQPVDGRPAVSTGAGITLVVAGAILRFAVTATFAHVLNAHVAGVIVMLAGVFALLLSLLVWGPLNRRRGHSGGGRVPRVPLRHGEGNKEHLSSFGGLAALSLDALSPVAYGKAGCPHPRRADRAEFENPGKV
jgi:hypothetical protein